MIRISVIETEKNIYLFMCAAIYGINVKLVVHPLSARSDTCACATIYHLIWIQRQVSRSRTVETERVPYILKSSIRGRTATWLVMSVVLFRFTCIHIKYSSFFSWCLDWILLLFGMDISIDEVSRFIFIYFNFILFVY